MRSRRISREPEVDPFYDMLFNLLIAFVFCFIVALLAMNPKALKAGDIPAKAEFIVTMSWPDYNPDDIDAWVQGPSGDLVWFRNREAGLMHLDRDDRGMSNDTIVVNGKTIVNPLNQEVVTIRGIAPGEYVVNANYYESLDIQLERAQTVVVLNTPWWICSSRAFRRGLRRPGGVMPEGCKDSVRRRISDEWGMVGRIWLVRRSAPEQAREMLLLHGPRVAQYVLRTKRAAREFLSALSDD